MSRLGPQYWMPIVDRVAEASTCRVKIGCVIVQQNHLAGVGFLGSLPGYPHCTDAGCLYIHAPHMGTEDKAESCIRTIHAETNAVMDFLRRGKIWSEKPVVYCTYSPCVNCLKLLLSINVETIYYQKTYRDEWRDKFLLTHDEVRFEKYKAKQAT
jgi:dCMP deaminase